MTAKTEPSPLCAAEPAPRDIDAKQRRIDFHRREIRRYSRMLATGLSEAERKYVHGRIAERYAALNRLLTEDGIEELAA